MDSLIRIVGEILWHRGPPRNGWYDFLLQEHGGLLSIYFTINDLCNFMSHLQEKAKISTPHVKERLHWFSRRGGKNLSFLGLFFCFVMNF